jgi:type I restriction enzyme S subunit
MNRQGIQTVALRDLIGANRAELQTGPFGTQLHASSYVHNGVPVVAVKNIGDNSLVTTDIPMISGEDALRLSRHRLQVNDILFSRKGAVERRALIRASEQGWIQGSDCIRLRFDDSIDARYVSYFLGSMQARQWLKQHAHGATMPSLNQQILGLLQIPLPPLSEQRAIAHVLGTLDDKIEINRKMNATLDEIARTLFTSWFVDFDPVRAKAEGRQPAGMDAATAALFPDRFVDSELSPIPEGWSIETLDSLCSTQYGYTASATEDPTGVQFLRVKDMNKANWVDWSMVPFCEIDDTTLPRYALEEGDVLVARMADPGKAAIVEEPVTAVFASYLVRLRFCSQAWSYFGYGFLKSSQYEEFVQGARSGSVQANMNARVIVSARLAVPSEEPVNAYYQLVLPLRAKIAANLRENTTLTKFRDTLLPELLSGQVRLPVAEQVVGSVM